MAEKSGFFNAKLVSGSYDRTYQAEDFANCLSMFIPNGIYVTNDEALQEVVDKTTVGGLKPYGSGTSLKVAKGKAFINGYWYVLESDATLTIDVNTTKYVMLTFTAANREIKLNLANSSGVSKGDAVYDILIGRVQRTSGGLTVTDMRTDFMLGNSKMIDARLTRLDNLLANIFLEVYPIGSIYMSTSSTSPHELFGGSWVKWGSGRVPIGVNVGEPTMDEPEKTGGSFTASLSEENIPKHRHDFGGSVPYYNINRMFMVKETAEGKYVHEAVIGTGATGTRGTETTGSGTPFDVTPEFITCYMWKRVG